MKQRTILLTLLSWITIISLGWSAEAKSLIYLDQLLEEALKNNPEVLAAQELWQAAKSRPSQVRSLPDPELSFSQRNVGSDYTTLGREGMSNIGGVFIQRIPFPGKLALKGEIAEKEADQRLAFLEATKNRIRSQVKLTYYDLYFVYKAIATIEKDKDILEKFAKTAEARYAVGQGIQQDVLRAQVEISRLLDKLNLLYVKKESLVAALNSLLNRSPFAPLGQPAEITVSEFPYSLEELNRLALERSPQLREKQRLIERNQAAVALARKEYLPDLSIKGGFFYRGDYRDMWEIGLSISIPLYFRTKQRYGVKEAIYNLDAAEQEHQAIKQRILAKIKEFYISATTAKRLMELFRKGIIPQATLALESSRSAYEVGKVDFLTLLDNLISLLDDELRYYEELVNFEKAIARIEEITGPLD